MTGLIIESEGPEVSIGQVCAITSPRHDERTEAQVVGFRDNAVLLMAFESVHSIHPGCKVTAKPNSNEVPSGSALLGRVIDGMGRPIDGKGPLLAKSREGFYAEPPNPLSRGIINEPLGTGIKAIYSFVPLGRGQLVGIFSVRCSKSILLGMVARGSETDVNVISLVGERGRELREFVENDLGSEGLAKSVIVISTSDQPAPMLFRLPFSRPPSPKASAMKAPTSSFLDSLTVAMAQREIGLAVGEPPASRGYVPSVFSMLPRLLERAGMSEAEPSPPSTPS